jgi:hypothetical protein
MLVPLSVIATVIFGKWPKTGSTTLVRASFAALVLLAAAGIALSLFAGGFAVSSIVFGVGSAIGALVPGNTTQRTQLRSCVLAARRFK